VREEQPRTGFSPSVPPRAKPHHLKLYRRGSRLSCWRWPSNWKRPASV